MFQPRPDPRVRSAATTAGIVIAVVLGIFGLVMVGFIVFFFIALSNFGSNK